MLTRVLTTSLLALSAASSTLAAHSRSRRANAAHIEERDRVLHSNMTAGNYQTLNKRGYNLVQNLQSTNDFLGAFTFSTAGDQSGGTVQYVDQGTANSLGMYGSGSQGGFKFGADHTQTGTRKSIRLESNRNWGYGVFIWDVDHAPTGCGTWPALWSTTASGNWPQGGEIDVFEQVNGVTSRPNQATLHTGPGCTFSDPRGQTGTTLQSDCNVANGANGNAGCGVSMTGDANTFGTGLNNAGGGVFAMQHESSGVFVWHWGRDSAPAGTKRGDNSAIDVASWGTPDAAFGFYQGTCSADHIDLNQQLVMNIDFCGGFVSAFSAQDGCPSDCVSDVANNPGKFTEAYFDINSLKVFQQ